MKTDFRIGQVGGVPPSGVTTLLEIQKALEAAGVESVRTPVEGPAFVFRQNGLDYG